jgi:NitT/TauT family transport system substrate-binding protein
MQQRLGTFVLLVLLFLTGCTRDALAPGTEETPAVSQEEAPAEMTHVRLPMGFVADPQFAPFYVAQEKGYFAQEGLEIEFDYSLETDGMALVGAGELPLAIVSGEQVILARAQELPVVYVMEWFQRFPIAVISKQATGIDAPSDLAGYTVGLPGFFGASYVGYVGLLSAADVDRQAISEEEIGFTQIETLLADRVDAVVGYANNEPVQLQQQGEAINTIYVADYVDLVANGIVTNESTLARDPQLVQRFVRATLRGLSDTLADPPGAFEISKQYVEGLDDSRLPVLEASLPLWQADTLGYTDATSWEQTQDVLLQSGLLDEPLDNLDEGYTNEFVQEAQP